MIDKALEILKNGLHDYLRQLPGLNITSQQTVHLSHIIKQDGSIAIADNSLGLALINIEEEKVLKSQKTRVTTPDGQSAVVNPELTLNLYILIAANFANYKTSLEFLSGAIRFFQSKNVFTHQDTPELDSAIEKLIVELYTLDLEQEHHLWGILGGKYLPSVMYKVRLLSIQETQISDKHPSIRHIKTSERGV